jgi:uncharacterized protein YdhG (YjbR/CyaY superfamily)
MTTQRSEILRKMSNHVDRLSKYGVSDVVETKANVTDDFMVTANRFGTVKEYIASKPADVRVVLERVRRAIRKAVPTAQEGLSYQIPAYKLNGVALLYFAGWKAHYSLYPASDALVAAFGRELAQYKRSKGTIRLPFSQPVPVSLIERIARFRATQITTRERGKGARQGRAAQLERVRRMTRTLPGVSEKLSHGMPSFFVEKDKGVFASFVDNHHDDGRLAVWLPVREGLQSLLIEDAPAAYFKPPYVGPSGWVGILLDQVRDDTLQIHLRQAWEIIARKLKGKHGQHGSSSRRPRTRSRPGRSTRS